MDVEKQINDFLNELMQFDYELESRDRIWHLIFPDEKKQWYYIRVVQYIDTYFIDHNVGIVPHFHSLHRANQRFSKDQTVYDVMHYDDLSRYKRRLTPFIVWEALPQWKPSQ